MSRNTPHFTGSLFFVNDTATTEIYTLSLHDALPISKARTRPLRPTGDRGLVGSRHGSDSGQGARRRGVTSRHPGRRGGLRSETPRGLTFGTVGRAQPSRSRGQPAESGL